MILNFNDGLVAASMVTIQSILRRHLNVMAAVESLNFIGVLSARSSRVQQKKDIPIVSNVIISLALS
jgi:hypothetical protein